MDGKANIKTLWLQELGLIAWYDMENWFRLGQECVSSQFLARLKILKMQNGFAFLGWDRALLVPL
jgi:hypothetical protein